MGDEREREREQQSVPPLSSSLLLLHCPRETGEEGKRRAESRRLHFGDLNACPASLWIAAQEDNGIITISLAPPPKGRSYDFFLHERSPLRRPFTRMSFSLFCMHMSLAILCGMVGRAAGIGGGGIII